MRLRFSSITTTPIAKALTQCLPENSHYLFLCQLNERRKSVINGQIWRSNCSKPSQLRKSAPETIHFLAQDAADEMSLFVGGQLQSCFLSGKVNFPKMTFFSNLFCNGCQDSSDCGKITRKNFAAVNEVIKSSSLSCDSIGSCFTKNELERLAKIEVLRFNPRTASEIFLRDRFYQVYKLMGENLANHCRFLSKKR